MCVYASICFRLLLTYLNSTALSMSITYGVFNMWMSMTGIKVNVWIPFNLNAFFPLFHLNGWEILVTALEYVKNGFVVSSSIQLKIQWPISPISIISTIFIPAPSAYPMIKYSRSLTVMLNINLVCILSRTLDDSGSIYQYHNFHKR